MGKHLAKIILDEQARADFKKALEFVKKNNNFFIITHDDVDGLGSSYMLRRLMRVLGKSFYLQKVGMLHPSPELTNITKRSQNYSCVIYCDIGSSFLEKCKEISNGRPTLILDHHEVVGEFPESIQINPLKYGEDGLQNCCGTVLAFLLLCMTGPKELYRKESIQVLLAGITGDKQDLAPTHTNKRLFQVLLEEKILLRSEYFFDSNFNIEDFLTTGFGLYFKEFQNSKTMFSFCKSLQIGPKSQISKIPSSVKDNFKKAILDEISKFPPTSKIFQKLERYYTLEKGQKTYCRDTYELFEAFQSSNQIDFNDVCPNSRKNNLLIRDNWRMKRNKLSYFLKTLISTSGDTFSFLSTSTKGLGPFLSETYFYFINPSQKHIQFLHRVNNSNVMLSARTTLDFVAKGVDLSEVMSGLARKYGGSGGGHKVAAGAKIPLVQKKELIHQIEIMLKSQGFN